jgi:hypothetical protein
MKKTIGTIAMLFLLSGCAETVALLGPASTSLGGGKVAQSAFSSALSFGVKQQTGKSPLEHAMTYVEDHNPKQKKEKCIFFLESTNSEICAAAKKNILETRKRIVESSKTEFLNYKN